MIRKAKTTMLLQSQIENAMRMTRSNRAAAEYLRVSYNLYRKFAKAYKNDQGVPLFEAHRNQSGTGIAKSHVSDRRFKLDEILIGKHPQYPVNKLKRRLVVSGYIEESCAQCGFSQKRPSDLKTPLILNHLDGDGRNHKADNLQLLCYNCFFILVGDINRKDLRTTAYDRPEEDTLTTQEDVELEQQKQQALYSLDVLSEEEKLAIIKGLSNI